MVELRSQQMRYVVFIETDFEWNVILFFCQLHHDKKNFP